MDVRQPTLWQHTVDARQHVPSSVSVVRTLLTCWPADVLVCVSHECGLGRAELGGVWCVARVCGRVLTFSYRNDAVAARAACVCGSGVRV